MAYLNRKDGAWNKPIARSWAQAWAWARARAGAGARVFRLRGAFALAAEGMGYAHLPRSRRRKDWFLYCLQVDMANELA